MSLKRITDDLVHSLEGLAFSAPVTHVYNPLRYARRIYDRYLRLFGRRPKQVLLVGMNPGPWGMAQTGIPFGEISAVRDWMGLNGTVDKPVNEHPKRPVTGLDCSRSEVSGQRLWGAFAERFADAEAFFADHFVINYCPLSFMEASGRNRTPDKLPADERDPLFTVCDEALTRMLEALQPTWVIGVGAFAGKRARLVCGDRYQLGSILHPSPASPAANRGWAAAATGQLIELGVWA